MPLNPQPRKPSRKKPACVLRRPALPTPQLQGGENAEIAVVGSRVRRLLQDARAMVRAQGRPDTPLVAPPPPPPKRNNRLTAMISSASSAPSHSVANGDRMDRGAFESALDAAQGEPRMQLQRLGELKRWVANPHHTLWDTALTRLVDLVLSPNADAEVALCAVSILLRCGDVVNFPALPVVVRRLHEMCGGGLDGQLLEVVVTRESIIKPLLHLLGNDELLRHQPSVLWDALETLRSCSTNSDVMLTHLVTLGVIPEANMLMERILSYTSDSPSMGQKTCNSFVFALLPPLCLLYRNLSTQYSHHLRKLGSLDCLVNVLDRFRDDGDVVQAAARAMAKTAFEDCCLEHYQRGTRACRVVVMALEANMDLGGLTISRLCSTLARLVESSRELRDWLMQHHHRTLVRLVETHVMPHQDSNAAVVDEWPRDEEEVRQEEDLLQSITWLVGVVAMSAECSTTFVLEITPLLVAFMKDLDAAKWHLTFIHTLMCLSNLSFFFAEVEKLEGGHAALVEMYMTLGLILAGVLFDGDTEATVEATRVLGNISLTNAGRDWMESNRCDEVCIVFLGHEDPRIVYNCFGVLLNLTAADACRIVADPELMQMLLQQTGRYTRGECILEERTREISLRGGAGMASADKDGNVSYTDQIADVVDKLLLNLSGLI